jgi:hypothetical protein
MVPGLHGCKWRGSKGSENNTARNHVSPELARSRRPMALQAHCLAPEKVIDK